MGPQSQHRHQDRGDRDAGPITGSDIIERDVEGEAGERTAP
ncbi:hypothetical protein [Dactylosporangium sp. NPDC049140]